MAEEVGAFFLGIFVAGVLGLLVAVSAFEDGKALTKQDAVNANAAEWTVDKNGERGFRWLPAKQPEPAR